MTSRKYDGMEPYPTCPYCKTKKSATTIFLCKKEIRGCSQIFCRECCGGLTTVRCPNCQEAEFSGIYTFAARLFVWIPPLNYAACVEVLNDVVYTQVCLRC